MLIFFRNQRGIISLLISFITQLAYSQSTLSSSLNLDGEVSYFKGKTDKKKSNFGFELTANVLPKASISKDSGVYQLRSKIQSSYSLGFNYIMEIRGNLFITTGLQFQIGKKNFFSWILNSDLPGYSDNGIYIEDKSLWSIISIPLVIERPINRLKINAPLIKAGLNLRYSGYATDEKIQGSVFDSISNNKAIIFNADLYSNNNHNPWITFLIGISKRQELKNKNILSFSIQSVLSPVYFLRGRYQITIPRKPISTGTYKISGTSLGLSVQYIFT